VKIAGREATAMKGVSASVRPRILSRSSTGD
jgi:hypothetical protein